MLLPLPAPVETVAVIFGATPALNTARWKYRGSAVGAGVVVTTGARVVVVGMVGAAVVVVTKGVVDAPVSEAVAGDVGMAVAVLVGPTMGGDALLTDVVDASVESASIVEARGGTAVVVVVVVVGAAAIVVDGGGETAYARSSTMKAHGSVRTAAPSTEGAPAV